MLYNPESESYEIERIDRTDGIKVYFKGIPYPMYGLPTEDAVRAVAFFKEFILQIVKRPLYWGLHYKKIPRILPIYILPYNEQGKVTREFIYLVRTFLIKLKLPHNIAESFAHIFEYDMAYRYRLQDLFTETSIELLQNPRKEITRLLQINNEREKYSNSETGKEKPYKIMVGKFQRVGKLLRLLLLCPIIKKAFVDSIQEINIKNLQFDEADRYWCCQRTDYNFFGKSFKERTLQCKKMRNPTY